MFRLLLLFCLLSSGKAFAQMDTEAPEIKLIGDSVVYVCQNQPYTDSGYYATDNYDPQSRLIITSEGDFTNTDSNGVYKLRYKATDRSRNYRYSGWRYIYVIDKKDPNCKGGSYNPTTGITTQSQGREVAEINIYPNPAQNEFYLKTPEYVSSLSIYFISGQKLSEISINQKLDLPYKIDTKHFPAGIYMVRIQSGTTSIVKRIEIIH